jgi:hypothetical protein
MNLEGPVTRDGRNRMHCAQLIAIGVVIAFRFGLII